MDDSVICHIFIAALLACLACPALAVEYTATWDRYTHSPELTLVGFKLWHGGDTLVAEFPGWARGGRWTQETPIASGEAFTLTAVFAGSVGVWTDASCSDEQYTEQATCEAADATWTAGSCSADGYSTEAECEGTESPRSAVYVFPMGDGTSGIHHARFKTVAGVVGAPLTKQHGALLR